MKKSLLIIAALLMGVSGMRAQLTSISDGGLYSIQFCRADQVGGVTVTLGITSDLKHAKNYTEVTKAVFKLESAGADDKYYIKEYSSNKYVYATNTTNSTSSDLERVRLGNTEIPSNDDGDGQINKKSAYVWEISSVGTVGVATNAWLIKPSQNTSTYWSAYYQTTVDPISFWNTATSPYSYYRLGLMQFVTPTLDSYIQAGFNVGEITTAGYTKDQIAEYYKPAKLDVVGWPTTAAWNTFKSNINALANDAVVNTAYLSHYQTMCSTYTDPTVGAFYRIKDKDNKYVYATGVGEQLAIATTPTTPMSSVFYTTNAVNSLRFISFFNGYYVTSNQGSTTIINSSPATWFGYSFNHESTHPLGSLRIKDNLNYYWYTHSDNKVYNSNSSNTNANRAFYFEEVTSLPIILNDGGDGNYYATLYLPVDIELSDATAYIPTVSGNELVCNLDNGITQVPAGTGVILKGSSNSATATIISGLSASTSSVLSGYYPTTARNSATCYVFSKVGDNVGFFNYTGDNIPGFKAYLPATALGGGSNGYVLTFTDEDPTAVQSIADSQKVRDAQVFDLQGRKVKNPAKGNIYIQNGKKVLY